MTQSTCQGFVAGATANVILTYKVGFGKVSVDPDQENWRF